MYMKILRKLFKKKKQTILDVKKKQTIYDLEFECHICGEKNLKLFQKWAHNNKHKTGIFHVRRCPYA